MAFSPDYDEDLIYRLASGCEELFDKLQAALAAANPESGAVELCVEFQQRFAIWAAHLGVFARKSQSLDTRLRGYPDLQDLVVRLLNVLRHGLQRCETHPTNQEGRQGQDATWPENPSSQAENWRVVKDAITRLNSLGVTIRRSNNDKLDIRAKNFAAKLDLEPFASLCATVIQSLYPGAHWSLKSHLRRSMMDRYARMQFLESRHQKLKTRREPRTLLSTITEAPSSETVTPPPVSQLGPAVKPRVPAPQSTSPSGSDLSSVNIQKIRERTRPADETSTRYKTSTVQLKRVAYPPPPLSGDSSFFACEWCSEPLNETALSVSEWRYVPLHPRAHRLREPSHITILIPYCIMLI